MKFKKTLEKIISATLITGSLLCVTPKINAEPTLTPEPTFTPTPTWIPRELPTIPKDYENNLFVDDSNHGYEDGTEGNPYEKIQTAIDNAEPRTIIHVKGADRLNPELEGDYVYSSVYIDNTKNDLYILGDGAEKVTISGRSSTNPVWIDGAKNIFIEGFTIANGFNGIFCRGGASGMIHRNIIISNEAGVLLQQSPEMAVINNTIDGASRFGNSQFGMNIDLSDLPREERYVLINNNIIGDCNDYCVTFNGEVSDWRYYSFNNTYHNANPEKRAEGELLDIIDSENYYNMSEDPLFVNSLDANYRLITGKEKSKILSEGESPCLKAGTSDGINPDYETDLGVYQMSEKEEQSAVWGWEYYQ